MTSMNARPQTTGTLAVVVGMLVLTFVLGVQAQQQKHSPKPISEARINSLIQAITDEMYAEGLAKEAIDVGQRENNGVRLNLFVKPTLTNENNGWAIYKLMPYGQVLRMFHISDDGTVLLEGELRNGFPSTQPSYKTVYMDEDELCAAEHDWIRRSFFVELQPNADAVREARQRQHTRELLRRRAQTR
jgi:hypothetical protein